MKTRELSVAGAFEFTPAVHGDQRGSFHEWFRADVLSAATGKTFSDFSDAIAQANCSVSAVGTLRGVHFAQVAPGQAKYVTCLRGAFVDYVIDLRPQSPTFLAWDTVLIDDTDRRAVYLPEGLGHAIVALEDASTAIYLCSTPYTPEREHTINPFDPDLAIGWPTVDRAGRPLDFTLSQRDEQAQSFAEALDRGLLG